MDFDTDGCYNTPAIDAAGNVVTGLNCGSAVNGYCRDLSDLQNNNIYSRARCSNPMDLAAQAIRMTGSGSCLPF